MSEPLPLEGLRVIDCATLFAGPLIGTILGDFGADVIKVEHPRGDSLRSTGWRKDGESLWWTFVARNKRSVTIDLGRARGQTLMRHLLADADVLIENFRPGTLERWNLDPKDLLELNPRLVVVRTTGFGQTGPYAQLPGYGTLAESISGFAHANGWPDKPPALPSFPFGDTIAALTGTFAAMFALWWRANGGSGKGQIVDLSIYEPTFWVLGPQALIYDQLGVAPTRAGNSLSFAVPRNAYQAKDGHWLGLSATSQTIAERVMRLIGRPELIDEPWFADNESRKSHADELDAVIQEWIGRHTTDEVVSAFAKAEAAIAPIYSIEEIVHDPQYIARETITRIEHPLLGDIPMQNVITRLSETPGRIRHVGPRLGEHNDEVLIGELGLSRSDIDALVGEGVIGAYDSGEVPTSDQTKAVD